MGAMVTIIYDSEKVSDEEVNSLTQGIQKMVSETMGTKDVFVYANKPRLVLADPIEVFIQVNKNEVNNPDQLTENMASQLSVWKKGNQFKPTVNINIHPVEWHYKIGV